MELPDDVKQKAMDAVAHKETTSMIRAFQGSGAAASHEAMFNQPEAAAPEAPEKYQPLTDEVKKQAMDAVAHKETTAMIQLAHFDGTVTAPHTPSEHTTKMAEKIAGMYQNGQDADSVHQAITKDNFGREHG